MKRIAFAAAAVVLAACSTKEQTPAADTAAPAMTPAPAAGGAMDSSAMKMDSAAMKGGMMDSSAMKSDTGAMKKTP